MENHSYRALSVFCLPTSLTAVITDIVGGVGIIIAHGRP
jgi:hypothetical protein